MKDEQPLHHRASLREPVSSGVKDPLLLAAMSDAICSLFRRWKCQVVKSCEFDVRIETGFITEDFQGQSLICLMSSVSPHYCPSIAARLSFAQTEKFNEFGERTRGKVHTICLYILICLSLEMR